MNTIYNAIRTSEQWIMYEADDEEIITPESW